MCEFSTNARGLSCLLFAEVGAAGGVEAEVGLVGGDARRFPPLHPRAPPNRPQILGLQDGAEARADLHITQRQR